MEIITIDEKNIDSEHICCALGNDKKNLARANSKKQWMKERFNEGLVFKRLYERGKMFIEYMPIENVWRPIIGKNYLVIHCLWVAGKFKEKGIEVKLINECIKDAKKQKKDGVCLVTCSKKKGFILTPNKIFEKEGFEICDTAPPYFELRVLKINKKAKSPEFSENAKKGIFKHKKDFSFVYSNQCPFVEEYVGIMADVLKKKKISFEIIKLESKNDAQKLPCPFGAFSLFYKGKIKTHEIMPEKKFEKFLGGIKLN